MELRFIPETHTYQSIDDTDRKWISVTSLIRLFHEPFDQQKVAEIVSKKPKSKWYGIPPEKIIQFWNKESERASTLGSWYHDQREKETIACNTIRREGIDLPIYHPIIENGVKISPEQSLTPGIYPEHFMYLKSANICGQADRVEVIGNKVNIIDYKTNKKINLQGPVISNGKVKKMKSPISHLDDCNLIHYTLQLSIYLYIILKHNHQLEPGKLTIQHVIFEVESEDEFGSPVMAVDPTGDPIVKEVIPYEVPFLKKEVQSIIKYLKLNPQLLS